MRETVKQLGVGGKAVGTTAVKIVTNPISHPEKGILIKAPGPTDDTPNTVSVFIGLSSSITATQADGAFPLAPGESISIPASDVEELYAIAGSASQFLNWINA